MTYLLRAGLFLVVISCDAVATAPSAVRPSQLITSGTNSFQSFGESVAVDGRRMVIGAPHSGDRLSGAAFIYGREGGAWILEQRLVPPQALPTFGYFGRSVAVSGDTAVIGVGTESSDAGQTYVYRPGTSQWILEQIIPARGQVAIDADTIVVTDYGATVYQGQSDIGEAGVAHVYVRSNGVWSFQQTVWASDPRESGYFGRGVAIEGDTLVIGAIGDLGTGDESGAAYVFVREGTHWTQTQKLRASDPQRAADFGRALDLKGNLLVIGAPGYVDWTDQYKQEGFAYVFVRSEGTWTQQQKLRASDATPRDGFGCAVAVTEHQIVVGQFNSSAVAYEDLESGAAYVFRRQGQQWVEQGKLAPNHGQAPDLFGLALAADDDTIVAGDPTIVGSAYVYNELVLGRLRRDGTGLILSFASEPGRSYVVESTESVAPSTTWETVTQVTGNGSVVEVPINPTGAQRFYQVRLNPGT